MHRVTVGNVEVIALQDTPLLMDPRQFLPAHAEQFLAEYKQIADERGLMAMSVTCFLVRSAGRTYLVDTGLGPRRKPGFPQGKLDQALSAAGVRPDEVDVVLNTHLHLDHVGWNTVDRDDGTREIFFPKARFLIQQAEWDHWMRPRFLQEPANAHLVECVEPVSQAGRVDLIQGEVGIDANLTYVTAPGHTPGHVAIGIASAGERAVIIGDASHHPVHLDHPDWSPAFDTDPELAARTRDRLIEDAIESGRTWIAGHWPHPGWGRIVRLNGKRVFQAL